LEFASRIKHLPLEPAFLASREVTLALPALRIEPNEYAKYLSNTTPHSDQSYRYVGQAGRFLLPNHAAALASPTILRTAESWTLIVEGDKDSMPARHSH
jgi:hypothetical protein